METVYRRFTVRDPFAGWIEVAGETIEEAVAAEYEAIPEQDRPTFVWYFGRRMDVPGGMCHPLG